jgi:tRNA(Ile)-lysidine synthase
MIHLNKKLIPDEFAVAISGGVDSLAAAHFLHRLNYKFKAIHYNHNQRPQNDKMQEACERFCRDFKIDLIVGICNTKVEKNVEDGLRKERIKFFQEIGGTIIYAHHLNDAVENYLSNCIKGKPEHEPIPQKTNFGNFTAIRPFLRNPKIKFENWVDRHDLNSYVEADETNSENKYERNWLRNVIIPQIEGRKGLEKVVLKKFYL